MSIYPKILNTTQNYGHKHQRGQQRHSSKRDKNRAAHTHRHRATMRFHHGYCMAHRQCNEMVVEYELRSE